MHGEAATEGNESYFKLKVADYAKNGVRIKRVALLENLPYEDSKQNKKTKSRH
jgi:hypothetical protein